MKPAAPKRKLTARIAPLLWGAIVTLFLPKICWSLNDASDWPTKSTGALAFYVDLCQFQGSVLRDKTLTEIYYAIDLSQLYITSASNQSAVLFIELGLFSNSGDTLAHIHARKSVTLSDEARYSFVDLARFELEAPQSGVLHLAIHDSVSNRQGFVQKPLLVKKFSGALSLSDLLLSSQIQKAREKSNFEKGGLVIVPNPSRSFSAPRFSLEKTEGNSEQNLFVYFEINHLVYDRAKPSFYEVNYQVHDAQGNEVYSNTRANIPKTGADGARVEKIPLSALQSGRHRLTVQVTDLAVSESCQAKTDFTYDSGHVETGLPMTEADVRKYYDQIKSIATEEEKKLYWQLSVEGKQKFLLEFWRSKDPTPDTRENEFMQEHFRRLAYCESRWGRAGKMNADMARVYLKYGPPLEVIREASTLKINRAVEIWTYAIDGKREFVFVDRIGDGNYVLVHSNHVNEYNNPNWAEDFKN